MGAPPLTVAVGDSIPTFSRTTSPVYWNRFAAVNDEFGAMHTSDEVARRAGFDRAFGMGNLQWSYLHNLVRDFLADRGRIVSLACEFRAPNFEDSTLTARGTVTAVRDENGGRLVDLKVWIEDETGTVLAPGSATVELFE